MKRVSKILIVMMACVALTVSISKPAAYAGMIETEALLTAQQRAEKLAETQRFLLEKSVSEILVEYGVDHDSVFSRLASLTDGELLKLSKKIDELPAGAGALEVVGIVFLVLLLLELVGVTDVFKKL